MSILRKNWTTNLHLDSLGSLSVIAASVLMFLFVGATTILESMPPSAQVADICPPTRIVAVDRTDLRPTVPSRVAPAECG